MLAGFMREMKKFLVLFNVQHQGAVSIEWRDKIKGGTAMGRIPWKSELWEQFLISSQKIDSDPMHQLPRDKSFFDYQDPAQAYEVRGILPRAEASFRDRD